MITAQEALTVTINVAYAKIEKGKEKARNSIPDIEACIMRAAKMGEDYTVIYPMRMNSTDSAEEKSGYISELINILNEAEYKVDYNVSTENMQIQWAP